MENKDKKYTLKVRGQEVEVSEEVYRAYIRPIRAEQRRKRREWKCRKLSETGGYYVRCKERCENCPYYLAGNSALGNVTSLDRLVDCEVEIEDKNLDLESDYIERETQAEEYAALHKAIETLTPRQQEMVQMIYFEGKTQEEVAQIFGIDFTSVSHALKRIISVKAKTTTIAAVIEDLTIVIVLQLTQPPRQTNLKRTISLSIVKVKQPKP